MIFQFSESLLISRGALEGYGERRYLGNGDHMILTSIPLMTPSTALIPPLAPGMGAESSAISASSRTANEMPFTVFPGVSKRFILSIS